ncbi:dephospho-CoA kinase [Wansuia hejianensis]|uniref:Dephospho-CoA kinase n=1 Tax=Wansuia hejianensis TaxID=2763667 RepID=A0A7G9GEC8_9FIRM|nr:dephospho-CoA kinase [Wansuia hejianensis]QNM09160.1 dephospho-CoA kinase [Wansuia hejianensis]RHV92282.1 dephospho-CoA kinase [Lachnospiraceae bacterium OF09-33XD]
MRTIGITGGVGAGKSEVMAYLQRQYEAAVIRADDVGHLLMERGNTCYDRILGLFGRAVLSGDGELDRKAIAGRVFREPELLKALNDIVHPAVKAYVLHAFEQERKKGRKFVFLEAALLVEEKYDVICDELWYVYAEEPVRVERLRKSRQYSEEKIRNMMASQLTEEEFRKACCFVLDNSGDFQHTARQIDQRMRQYEIM